MGCSITIKFFTSVNCEWFEVIASSEIAAVATIMNAWVGPQPGKLFTLDLNQGQQVELDGTQSSLGLNDIGIRIYKGGQATGGSNTTLDDTTANWPLGLFDKGSGVTKVAAVVILSGTGAGKFSYITSNTNTQLVFPPVAGLTVDSTSVYAVVWTVNRNLDGATPLIFTPWESGSYSVEIAANKGVQPTAWGRANYFVQNLSISGPAVPMNALTGMAYDSNRDVFWAYDTDQSQESTWLVKIAADGTVMSRFFLATVIPENVNYDSGQDKLLVSCSSGFTNDTLIIVDPATETIVNTLVGAAFAYGTYAAFCPVNGLMYFSNGHVFNTATQLVVATVAGISREATPTFIAADNNVWYNGPNGFDGFKVFVVDPNINAIIHTIALPAVITSRRLAYVPATGKVYSGAAGYPCRLRVFDPVAYTLDHQTDLDQATQISGLVYRSQDASLWAGTDSYLGEFSDFIKIDPVGEAISGQLLSGPQVDNVLVSTNGVMALQSMGKTKPGETSVGIHAP